MTNETKRCILGLGRTKSASTSEARVQAHGLSCIQDHMYIGYFDEFGHNGAYKHRYDSQYKTHPVFGVGGFIIPAHNVRKLSGAFRNLKESSLKAEIEAKVRAKGK